MIRLAVSVEGRTEEEFVNSLLAPHLLGRSVDARPILLGRARGRKEGGGNVSVSRLASDIVALWRNFDAVTSFVDLYGFASRDGRTPDELEKAVFEDVGRRFGVDPDPSGIFPYVQKHEFEALLFCDVGAFARLPGVPETAVRGLRAIRAGFPGPEDIDDGYATAPSRRIETALPRYRKVAHGAIVAAGIGLPAMRAECPRFNAWVARMEGLKPA